MSSAPARAEAKARIRAAVWDRLADERIARFPFPPHRRIPNFAGAREAAERLMEEPELRRARRIKVNPDAPQRYVRVIALERGIEVFMPTPRLRAGFLCLDPKRIPEARVREAASLSRGARFAREVPLDEMPTFDVIVVGSVAVSKRGARCGKGEGYADLEYGILRSLGHPPVPIATTVHPVQVVASLPREPLDIPISIIATPDGVHRVARPPKGPDGIDWKRLPREKLEAMPVLAELRAKLEIAGRGARGSDRRGPRFASKRKSPATHSE